MIRGTRFFLPLILLFTLPLAAQRDFSSVDVTLTTVRGTVSMIEGAGGNIAVCTGPQGTFMVDAQYEALVPKIREALAGSGADDPRLILNTHWHHDHTDGNRAFGTTVPILAHENVLDRLSREVTIFGQPREPLPIEARPVITYEDSLTLHFNGETIRVVPMVPAHTDGDSVVWFEKANAVHMGDLMFAGRFPFVDLENGGDVESLVVHLKAILAEMDEETKIIPGHGPLSTKKDLESYVAMIGETMAWVKERIEKGMTLEEIKEEGLPSTYDAWSWGFIDGPTWIGILHGSMQREK